MEIASTSESFYDLVPVPIQPATKYEIPSDESLTDEKYVTSSRKKTQFYPRGGRGKQNVYFIYGAK